MHEKPAISVVVPLFNEEGNVKLLHDRIIDSLKSLGKPFEVVFVDDGSSDRTVEICRSLAPLKLIVFRRNFGQTAAFDAGFKNSTGDIIITMDGDLQNDPRDIPLLLAALDEGLDVVSGWRWQRKDGFMKRFFSRGANLLRKVLLRDKIHDSGCSLKAFRRECFEHLDLFGEMHRFIPALLELQGFRIGEVKVSHHPRVSGTTKYNWKRAIKGFIDMIAIWFWERYASRPLHLFGGLGIAFVVVGFLLLAWMACSKIFFGESLSEKIWPLMGVFFSFLGMQFFIFGLLADIVMKNYYKSHRQMNYTIRDIIDN